MDSGADLIVLGGAASHEIFFKTLDDRGLKPSWLLDINPHCAGRAYADRFSETSIYDFDACHRVLDGHVSPGARILTFATGPAGDVARQLAESFGLPVRSKTLTSAAVDKRALIARQRECGLPHPPTWELDPQHALPPLDALEFPAILKPARQGGGREVVEIGNRLQLEQALEAASNSGPLLLQQKLIGPERVIYLIVQDGRCRALLRGDNVFDPATGWPWPLGLAVERIDPENVAPTGFGNFIADVIQLLELRNDFAVVEWIDAPAGPCILDVEVNALSGFACSDVMDGGQLANCLVDTYLGRSISDKDLAATWTSCMTFLVTRRREQLLALSDWRSEDPSFVFEPPMEITPLQTSQTRVFKGGHVILRDQVSMEHAASRSIDITRKLLASCCIAPS